MTPEERANPAILNGSRRRRIARGSGTSVQAVNQLVKQFGQMQKMMRQLSRGKMPSLAQLAGRPLSGSGARRIGRSRDFRAGSPLRFSGASDAPNRRRPVI